MQEKVDWFCKKYLPLTCIKTRLHVQYFKQLHVHILFRKCSKSNWPYLWSRSSLHVWKTFLQTCMLFDLATVWNASFLKLFLVRFSKGRRITLHLINDTDMLLGCCSRMNVQQHKKMQILYPVYVPTACWIMSV